MAGDDDLDELLLRGEDVPDDPAVLEDGLGGARPHALVDGRERDVAVGGIGAGPRLHHLVEVEGRAGLPEDGAVVQHEHRLVIHGERHINYLEFVLLSQSLICTSP